MVRVIVMCAALVTVGGCSKKDEGAARKPTAKPSVAAPKPVAPCKAADCVVNVNASSVATAARQLAMQSIRLVKRHRHFPVGAMAVDHLITRELLMQDARSQKLSVTPAEVVKLVNAGDMVVLGLMLDGKRIYHKDGQLDAGALDMFIRRLGATSRDAFMAEQQLEQLAYKAGAKRVKATQVTDKDMREYYTKFFTTVSFEHVKYAVHESLGLTHPTTAQLATFRAKNEAKVRSYYDENKQRYQGVKKQVHVRLIFFRRRKAGSQGVKDPGFALAQAAHRKLSAGTDFAMVATASSEDPKSRARGGYVGWRNRKHLGYGIALVQAVASLPLKKVSAVVPTLQGFYVVRFEAERSGNLSYEQVRDDIAARMAHRPLAAQRAAGLAKAAMAKLAGGAAADTLFNAPHPAGAPKLTPEMVAKLRASKKMDPATIKQLLAAQNSSAKPLRDNAGKLLPTLTTLGPIRRDKFIPGLPGGLGSVKLVFETAPLNGWTSTTIDGDTYLVRVTKRTKPDWAKYETDKAALKNFLTQSNGAKAMDEWLLKACKKAVANKRVSVNKRYAQVRNDKGEMVPYTPCQTLKPDSH